MRPVPANAVATNIQYALAAAAEVLRLVEAVMLPRMLKWVRQNLTFVDRTAVLERVMSSQSETSTGIGLENSTMISLAFLVQSGLNTGSGQTFLVFLVAVCHVCGGGGVPEPVEAAAA